MERRFSAKNGLEVIIRPAQLEDALGIIKTVNSEAVERSYVLTEKIGKTVAEEENYLSKRDTQCQLFVVALMGNIVVGCLASEHKNDGRNVLEVGLHVQKGYRDMGIGKEMLEYALEWGNKEGFNKIKACIFTSNKRSLSLFKKLGFEEEGTRKKNYRIGNTYIDEVILGKTLN